MLISGESHSSPMHCYILSILRVLRCAIQIFLPCSFEVKQYNMELKAMWLKQLCTQKTGNALLKLDLLFVIDRSDLLTISKGVFFVSFSAYMLVSRPLGHNGREEPYPLFKVRSWILLRNKNNLKKVDPYKNFPKCWHVFFHWKRIRSCGLSLIVKCEGGRARPYCQITVSLVFIVNVTSNQRISGRKKILILTPCNWKYFYEPAGCHIYW